MEIHHTQAPPGLRDQPRTPPWPAPTMESQSLEEIMHNIAKATPAVRNNGGGHWNHSLWWTILSPNGGGQPTGAGGRGHHQVVWQLR
ncbi:MAG: hypothetical protein WKG07_02925 [Hymenobacter sp.]